MFLFTTSQFLMGLFSAMILDENKEQRTETLGIRALMQNDSEEWPFKITFMSHFLKDILHEIRETAKKIINI